jgi:hypothetical protein
VTTINNTIKATANARFPLAICASLGKNGAPAATPNHAQRFVESQHSCQHDGCQWQQHKIRQQRHRYKANIAQWGSDFRDSEPKSHRQHARHDKDERRDRNSLLHYFHQFRRSTLFDS